MIEKTIVEAVQPHQLPDAVSRRLFVPLDTVDVWLVQVPADLRDAEVCLTVLSAPEKERAARLRLAEDRARSIVARGSLRWILSAYSGVSAQALEIDAEERGKPRLRKPKTTVEFNLSHSGEFVLLGITAGRRCGVDIERIRPRLSEEAIAERFFCSREVEWLGKTAGGFVRLWTAKEAVIKAVGQGLAIPLSGVDVKDVVQGQSSVVTVNANGDESQQLWVSELRAPEGYAAAVAVTGPGGVSVRVMPE